VVPADSVAVSNAARSISPLIKARECCRVVNFAPLIALGRHQTLDVDLALANLGQVVVHLHPEPGVA
jgi:hypothetical protein